MKSRNKKNNQRLIRMMVLVEEILIMNLKLIRTIMMKKIRLMKIHSRLWWQVLSKMRN